MGKLTVNVPQVRGDLQFYPSALEKGCRSERSLKLAIAEMYVKGVSTRKVTDVLEKKLLALFFFWKYLVETKGKTLEEIEHSQAKQRC